MKISFKLLAFGLLACVFHTLPAASMAAELIEPSRTITKGSVKQMGKLSVYSEPPELEVLLDGVNIGKTPVISENVAPGNHVLKIKETQTEIFIAAGEPLRYSWFKGSFKKIPLKEKENLAPEESREENANKKAKKQESKHNELEYQPFYWPLNPNGPIF